MAVSNFDKAVLATAKLFGRSKSIHSTLGRLVIAKESGRLDISSYGIANVPRTFKLYPGLVSSMTLESILSKQGSELWAVGAWQFTPITFKDMIPGVWNYLDTTFDDGLQDVLCAYMLAFRKRDVRTLLTDSNASIASLVRSFSRIWASLPKDSSNKSFYSNGVDKALVDYGTTYGVVSSFHKEVNSAFIRLSGKGLSDNRTLVVAILSSFWIVDPVKVMDNILNLMGVGELIEKGKEVGKSLIYPGHIAGRPDWITRIVGNAALTSRFNLEGRTITVNGLTRTRAHKGVDFALPLNTPVFAGVKGTVTRVGFQAGGAGNYVVVRQMNREIKYFHLNSYSVKVGEVVAPTTKIGLSGNTGGSTGPHLHIELHVNGIPVDPMEWTIA